jgi:hypothetical protein
LTRSPSRTSRSLAHPTCCEQLGDRIPTCIRVVVNDHDIGYALFQEGVNWLDRLPGRPETAHKQHRTFRIVGDRWSDVDFFVDHIRTFSPSVHSVSHPYEHLADIAAP